MLYAVNIKKTLSYVKEKRYLENYKEHNIQIVIVWWASFKRGLGPPHEGCGVGVGVANVRCRRRKTIWKHSVCVVCGTLPIAGQTVGTNNRPFPRDTQKEWE